MPVKCYIWNTGSPLLQMKILHSRPQYYNIGRFQFCCWPFLSSVRATLSFQAPIQFVASTIKDHLRPNVVHIPLSSTSMIIYNDDDHDADLVSRFRLLRWWLMITMKLMLKIYDQMLLVSANLMMMMMIITYNIRQHIRCWWWWFWRYVTKCCSSPALG